MAAASNTHYVYRNEAGINWLTVTMTADSSSALFAPFITPAIHGYLAEIRTAPGTRVNLADTTAYLWAASGGGTNEYYCTTTAGASASLADPDYVVIGGAAATEGTVGSLSAGQWDYGDGDSLSYNTVYVRMADGSDPDVAQRFYIVSQVKPPQDNYDVYVLDDSGFDVAGAQAENRDINLVERAVPTYHMVNGVLTINVTGNNVVSASTTITLFWYPMT